MALDKLGLNMCAGTLGSFVTTLKEMFISFSKRNQEQGTSGEGAGQRIYSGLYTDNRKPDEGPELTNHKIMN